MKVAFALAAAAALSLGAPKDAETRGASHQGAAFSPASLRTSATITDLAASGLRRVTASASKAAFRTSGVFDPSKVKLVAPARRAPEA